MIWELKVSKEVLEYEEGGLLKENIPHEELYLGDFQ